MASHILVPMQYFRSGSFEPLLDSMWEILTEYPNCLFPKSELFGDARIGLWQESDGGDTIYPNTGSEEDAWWDCSNGASQESNLFPLNNTDYRYKDFQVTMSNDIEYFRIYRAFSPDNREYTKYTDTIKLKYPFVPTYQQALYIEANGMFHYDDNICYLCQGTASDHSDPIVITASAVYGAGIILSESGWTDKALTNWPSHSKALATYPAQNNYRYYMFSQSLPNDDSNSCYIYQFMHGALYNLPDYYQLQEISYENEYPGFSTNRNLLGDITWDGLMNTTNTRESLELNYDMLPSESVATIVEIFTLGRGGLPVLFVEDDQEVTTWRVVYMPELSIQEIAAKAYKVTLKLQEF